MTLTTTSHWGVVLEGDDADQINIKKLLEELIRETPLKVEIKSAHVSTYYNPEKDKPSESPSEAKISHQRGTGDPVRQGGKPTP